MRRLDERERPRPTYRRTRSIFLRGLGACLHGRVRIDGRAGRRSDRLARNLAGRGLSRPGAASPGPTAGDLLAAADLALAQRVRSRPARALLGRLFLGAALFAGFLPGLCAALLWLVYLSIVGGRPGLSGFSVGCSAPGGGAAGGAHGTLEAPAGPRTDEPWRFTVWLVRWLVFRLMFLSGVVKLASHDPAWSSWNALEFHYETQPLPTWTSWYIHQMPPWFHWLSVGFMFYAELVAPFFIFGPRPIRRVGFASLVLLQLLIAATGNYGFFNLLVGGPLPDPAGRPGLGMAADRIVTARRKAAESRPQTASRRQAGQGGNGRCRGAWRSARLGLILIAVTTVEMLERIWPERWHPIALVVLGRVASSRCAAPIRMACSR